MAKHSYIDNSLRLKFEGTRDYQRVIDDLIAASIQNIYIYDDLYPDSFTEQFALLVNCLVDDYNTKRLNYDSYLEKDMDLRLFAELRKSAALRFEGRLSEFYGMHSTLDTAEEVKQFRIDYIHAENLCYEGRNWQYDMLAKYSMPQEPKEIAEGFYWDFEDWFIDSKGRSTNDDDYTEEYI